MYKIPLGTLITSRQLTCWGLVTLSHNKTWHGTELGTISIPANQPFIVHAFAHMTSGQVYICSDGNVFFRIGKDFLETEWKHGNAPNSLGTFEFTFFE